MVMRDHAHNTRMAKGDNIASYLTKITQLRDEMAVVGEIIPEPGLVCIALNGFTK